MGTVTNGKKWAGACVNGKVVSGLVKNGVVFYRKPVSTYKRRIMVGDVLGGKTIYNDFKNDDSFFQEWLTSKDYSSFITSDQSTSNYDYFEFYIGSDESTYLSLAVNYPEKGEEISIYNYDNGNVTIVPKVTIRNDLNYDTVTSIVDNVAYRHLFIEDENIRPLKVGDKIVPGTKFYGVVPDDPNLNNMNTSIYDTNGNSIAYFNFSENAFVNELQVKTNQYSYTIMYSKSQFGFVNNSVLVSEVSYTIGDISDSQSNPNYKYLLVDTTTLGV